MTRDELARVLDGSADAEERRRLAKELERPDDATSQALEHGWAAPSGPNVFGAAFEAAHRPAPSRWWLGFAFAAAAATLAVAWGWHAQPREDGLKGVEAMPSLGLVVVALDPTPHRLHAEEAVQVGARLAVRAVTSQAAWVALDQLEGDRWHRVWPVAGGGVHLDAGESELADDAGAVVLRAEPGQTTWTLRLVGAVRPLDTDGARAVVEVSLVVSP